MGKYIDVVVIADDMGVQKGLLLRPQLYRKMIKPFHARYVQVIRQYTDAKILNHACGSIVDLVEDYIEIGIDALNPMQVSAAGMSPQNLKARFGGRMAFWGGIDTQYVLPKGTPDDVRQAVRSTLDVMGLEGGYVLGGRAQHTRRRPSGQRLGDARRGFHLSACRQDSRLRGDMTASVTLGP